MSNRKNILLGALCTLFPFGGFSYALTQSLSPELPDWAQVKVVEVEPAPLPARTYSSLDAPINVGLHGGRIRVSVSLAFATRLQMTDLLDLSVKIKEKQSSILARFTDIVLQEGEKVEKSVGLAAQLRKSLPQRLLDAVNEELYQEAIPTPVEEVLIEDLMISPG